MDCKKILVSGIAGGILLLVLQLAFSWIGNLVAPYDVFAIGGMRQVTDPLMNLFYAYPFVLSFAAAVVFNRVKGSLGCGGDGCPCSGPGFSFGLILILLVTVPSLFVIFSTMTYPAGFYIGNILFGLIGFPVLGMLYARIWGVQG